MLVTRFAASRSHFLLRFGSLLAMPLFAISTALAQPSAPAASESRPVILVLGDSLSAEYGLPRGTGWVALLSERLRASGAHYTVVNSSISGETTSGGRTRLPGLLKQHRPAIVVLELGGNDAMRGLPLATVQDNLGAMIADSRTVGARVLLVGLRVPPNYGRDYSERFHAAFSSLAKAQRVALVPFLLEGFADGMDLFQADRIHPNERAQPLMLDNVWPHFQPLLKPAPRSRPSP